MKCIFSDEQINFLRKNYHNLPYKEIAKQHGFTERQILGKLTIWVFLN